MNVRIDKLKLKLRGIAPETATSALSGLGAELGRLVAGPVRVTATATPGQLREAIAAAVATAVRKTLKENRR